MSQQLETTTRRNHPRPPRRAVSRRATG